MQCCDCSAFRCRKCEAVGDNWFLEEGGWQTCKILTTQFPPAVVCLDSTLYFLQTERYMHKFFLLLWSLCDQLLLLIPFTEEDFLQIKLVLFFSKISLKHKLKLLTSIRMGKKWRRDKTWPVKIKSFYIITLKMVQTHMLSFFSSSVEQKNTYFLIILTDHPYDIIKVFGLRLVSLILT